MLERKDIVTFNGNPVTLAGEEVRPGDKAPDFTALKIDLSELKLSDYKGRVVILTSFPSVDTSVCALQAKRFNEEAGKLKDDVSVITISVDLPFALGRFCAVEGIENEVTVSDHRDLDFGYKYGFVVKELRLLERGIVVIDKDGIIRHVEYCKEIAEHPDYDKALEITKSLI